MVLGPVVQSVVSLTTSLRHHFVKYMPTTLSNQLLCFVEKNVRIFCSAKDFHIFSTKNNSGFAIFMFKILTKMLTNDVVNFEVWFRGYVVLIAPVSEVSHC